MYSSFDSYLALGDSFTEGLDDRRPDGSFRGWADLVAGHLAQETPDLRYANLAVRGRRLAHVVEEQLPVAERMGAALISVAAGGNDLLGLRCDVRALGQSFAELVERLTGTGATVVVFTGFDARGRVPLGRPLAVRTQEYNAAIVRSAEELGAVVVDLWGMPRLQEDLMWAPDRLHLSTRGHLQVATAVLRALGRERPEDVADDVSQRPGWLAARHADLWWATTQLTPWVSRKVRGRSLGDGVEPKRPELVPLPTGAGCPGGRAPVS